MQTPSPDSSVQAKVWLYADYFMKLDVYRCNMLLRALSQMAFSPPGGLEVFMEEKRRECRPSESYGYVQYFRHWDSEGNVRTESVCRLAPLSSLNADLLHIAGTVVQQSLRMQRTRSLGDSENPYRVDLGNWSTTGPAVLGYRTLSYHCWMR